MGDVRLIDEVRSLIGDALAGVGGDFSRAQVRDAAANAVLPTLERLATQVTLHIVTAGVIRPGDSLVLRFGDRIPPDVAARVKGDLSERLPGVEVVVLGGVDDIAVYRPEAGE